MKTHKEMAEATAISLGCSQEDFHMVWKAMLSEPVAWSANSFVNQVATAMTKVGLEPNQSMISAAASRL